MDLSFSYTLHHSPHTAIQSKREREKLSSKKECAFRSNYLKLDYVYNTNDPQMCSKKGCLDRAHWYYTRRTYVTVCSLFGKLAVVSSSPGSDWSGHVALETEWSQHALTSITSTARRGRPPSSNPAQPSPVYARVALTDTVTRRRTTQPTANLPQNEARPLGL